MNSPSPFPAKLAIYTLKQAAAELSIHSNRVNIDESYLLHLAATGAISLSIAMSDQYKHKCHVHNFVNYKFIPMFRGQVNNYYKPKPKGERNHKRNPQIKSLGNCDYCVDRAAAYYMVDKNDLSKFLNVNADTIQGLISSGQASQTVFNDFFIYDPSDEIKSRLDSYIEDIQQDRDAGTIGIERILSDKSFSSLSEELQAKVLKEIPKVIKSHSIEVEDFIRYQFDQGCWNFGLINRNHFGDRVPFIESLNEPVELCEIEISINDLFIVKPEFERILNKEFRTPKSSDLVHGTTDEEELKINARFPSAILEACKSLKLNPYSLNTGNRSTNKAIKEWFKSRSEYKDLTDDYETFRKYLRKYIQKLQDQENSL